MLLFERCDLDVFSLVQQNNETPPLYLLLVFDIAIPHQMMT